MSVSPTTRRRLGAQGFDDLDDATLAEVAPWLRWSPTLCAIFMTLGVVLQSPVILWALAGTALLGVVMPVHPFDLIYNHGLRRLTRTRALPTNSRQRRFACALAAVWLLATGWAFAAGATLLGLILGLSLVAVAALVSVTDICIPSMIYNALFVRQADLAR